MATIYTPTNRLADGVIVGGNAYFNRATKPTARIDGSALQIGDRWRKNDDGSEWFWNGTYWLSSPFYQASTTSITLPYDQLGYTLFCHYVRVLVVSATGTYNGTNYIVLSVIPSFLWATGAALETKNMIPYTQNGFFNRPTSVESFLVNTVITFGVTALGFTSTNVGSPSSLFQQRVAKLSYIYS